MTNQVRRGAMNSMFGLMTGTLLLLVVLCAALYYFSGAAPGQANGGDSDELFLYCAAGARSAMEEIVEQYEAEQGVKVRVQYGGSNTLLSQLEVSQTGDLFLAADDAYTQLAKEKGLVDEVLPIAEQRPVIVVQAGNPKGIKSINDLLREDVRVAIGNPDQAAIGKVVRKCLTPSAQWNKLKDHVQVMKPTVNDVANDVEIGSVDAGIVWDTIAALHPKLEAIQTPELNAGVAQINLGVMTTTKNPTEALRFARYVTARDRGLKVFDDQDYSVATGDVWEESPELTFFAGSVNRNALDPIIERFEQREGVTINTVYNGCGILTAQMRSIQDSASGGFPDMYMACDVYYLNTVAELFQDGINISNTPIVIVTQKGNPKNIKTMEDLTAPGVRVVLGQPDQCTIGVLSRNLLQDAGIYDKLMAENVVSQTTASSLLIPAITTAAADAVLAYRTDTGAVLDQVEIIPIDSPLAKAVQPYSVARSSDFQQLGQRLFQAIAQSRQEFENAGFEWQLNGPGAPEAPSEDDNAVEVPSPETGASGT